MKFRFLLIAAVITALPTFALSQVPDNDLQVWTETTVAVPLVKESDKTGKEFDRLTLVIIGSLRLGQNRLAPVDERIGGGFELALNKNFTFSPTYLYIAGQPGRGRKEFEYRLRFDLSYEKKWKRFSIKNRGRVEYRIRHSREDSVRLRNKFTFKVPVTSGGKETFAPFAADEPYYDLTTKRWSRNDFSAGIAKKFNNTLSAEFFYTWRHNTSGLPRNITAVGVNLKFKLDR